MLFLKWFASWLILWHRAFRRLRMLLLRPAFRHCGKNVIFDPNGYYSFENIYIGDDVSIGDAPVFMATESNIVIGNKVMFGPNVMIIGGDHNTSVIGEFMYDVKEKRPENDKDVTIEDDVWIGSRAIILKGVKLGRGSIVAAGAVVNKEVLPYAVVGGTPARVINVRFGDLDTIFEHEAALYPPEKRLSKEFLCKVLENVRKSI